jgi:hypothetical protein
VNRVAWSFPLLLVGVGCVERVPGELVPAISPLTGLPVDLCSEAAAAPVPLQLTNVGDDEVTIDSVAFVEAPAQPAGLASFDEPNIDTTTLLADEVAFVQFTYRSPGGVAQQAILRVTSNAEANPVLDIPAFTDDFTPEQKALANCDD